MRAASAGLSSLEPLVLRLCEHAVEDRDAFRRHSRLVGSHEELRAREAVKHQDVAVRFATALVERGAPEDVATVAGQVAVACWTSGRSLAGDPGDLVAATADAFRAVLSLS